MRANGIDRRTIRHVSDEPALLAELIALSWLERDPSRLAFGLDDLAAALVEIPRSINLQTPIDAAAVLAQLQHRTGWTIDRASQTARLAPEDRLHELARDRAARLDAAQNLLSRWPPQEARPLARVLRVARTYRLITITAGDLAPCLDAGTWGGQDFMATRLLRAGDGLMFHVKQVGRLRALAIVTRDPHTASEPSWQDTPGKTFRHRVAFRVLARLEDGIDTRAVIAPLRAGEAPGWFKGFVATNHVLRPDDAAALLDAFEAALTASV